MPQGVIAKDGKQKNISETFTAVNGQWKRVNDAYLAVNGNWKSGWSGAPELELLTLDRSSVAPWTRLGFSYQITGMWDLLRINLHHPSGAVTTLAEHPAVTSPSTVSQTAMEILGLVPNSNYTLEATWRGSSGKWTSMGSLAQSTVAPPIATNFWPQAGITHNAGGIAWSSFTDVQDWHSVRNNDGKAWHHGGDLPYIWEGGLSPSTHYYYQTQCMVGGVWGAYSAQQYFATAPQPYAPGDYYLYPNGNSQTYQSGGSQGSDWQGNDRSWWYHGNGGYWGSSRGTQRTCIYYNNDNTMQTLRNAIGAGASVTRTRIYVHRANDDCGNGGGVPSTIALNNAPFSNAPSNISGNHHGPHLNKGAGAWFDIPAHWGTHLFQDPGYYTGIIMGDTGDKNFYMCLGKNNYSTGNLIITIA